MAKAFTPEYVTGLLMPFRDEAGGHFDKLSKDIHSFLCQYSSAVVTTEGEWKAGTKGKLTSKSGHTLQLPLNSALTALVQFSLRIRELEDAGSVDKPVEHAFTIQANFPAACEGWFNTNYRAKKEVAKA